MIELERQLVETERLRTQLEAERNTAADAREALQREVAALKQKQEDSDKAESERLRILHELMTKLGAPKPAVPNGSASTTAPPT